MAQIGLRYPVVAELVETTNGTSYKNGMDLEEARNLEVSIETATNPLYGSDRIVEDETYFDSGTISFEATRLLKEKRAFLLGNQLVSAGIPGKPDIMEVVSSDGDVAPYVGFGIYMPIVHYGVKKYRAVWFTKVKFSEPNIQGQTKEQGAVTYQTPTLSGTVERDITGKWKREVTVDSEAEAKAWLNAIAGIGVPADKTALEAAITTAETLVSEDYTSQSWVAFANALAKAIAVVADPSVSQSLIDNALSDLEDAQLALIERL